MDYWIPVTLAAAFFQTIRFMLQKHLSAAALGPAGATFARFVYSAPLLAVALAGWLVATGTALPALGPGFWPFAVAGGLAQILATLCVVMLFGRRNFATGITFKKTEVVQTAFIGLVVLGEAVSVAGLVAILVGLTGVLLLSETPDLGGAWWRRIANRSAGIGLLSGLLFGISGVSYRGATLAVESGDALLRAAVTLSVVTLMQTGAMAAWLAVRSPGRMARVWAARRVALWVGLSSLAGSLCWFTAFTLQIAAYVNALGQVELVFSLLASVLVFRERVSRTELAGIALLSVSILGLIAVT